MMNWVRWLVLLTQYLPPVSASLLLTFDLSGLPALAAGNFHWDRFTFDSSYSCTFCGSRFKKSSCVTSSSLSILTAKLCNDFCGFRLGIMKASALISG